jgi:hypothetical protein
MGARTDRTQRAKTRRRSHQDILDTNTIRDNRRAIERRQLGLDFGIYGHEYHLDTDVVHGEIERPVFPNSPERGFLRRLLGPMSTIAPQQGGAARELLTTPENLSAFIQKTVIDLQVGQEEVPLPRPRRAPTPRPILTASWRGPWGDARARLRPSVSVPWQVPTAPLSSTRCWHLRFLVGA